MKILFATLLISLILCCSLLDICNANLSVMRPQTSAQSPASSGKMKGCLVFPGPDSLHETVYHGNSSSSEKVDLRKDFKQILKMAKERKRRQLATERRSQGADQDKKSWKTAFSKIWRSFSDRKGKKHADEASTSLQPPSHVSGPIYGAEGAAAASGDGQRLRLLATSGPLTSVFHQKDGIPYVRLNKANQLQYDANNNGAF